jgi:hypothetical protein
MPIDGSDARVTLESTRLIESPRRITPDTPARKYNENNDRGNHDHQPPTPHPPHDIIDVSAAAHSSHELGYPLLPEPDSVHDQASEHHLDIQA